MAVKIDMSMPNGCAECAYKKNTGYGVDLRTFCKLTEIEFNGWRYRDTRFPLCPLKEVK